jgi:acetyltransferase-like isoleucine patch superfamily enzyme
MIIVKLVRAAGFRIKKIFVHYIPYFGFIKKPQNPTQHMDFGMWFKQKIMGYNYHAYWPMHFTSKVSHAQNILVGKGSFPGFMPGCYVQGIGHIEVGDYSIFSANVGIISANHDLYNSSQHVAAKVSIGSYCWIGMNVVILPGVSLGDYTIVGAGTVVTKSFSQGYCVIGGNPAKIIKTLEKEKCIGYEMNQSNYRGYIREDKFPAFAKKYLNTVEKKADHSIANPERGKI